MTPILSCAFNTSLDSHEHARIAEQLGYRRAWFFDSPALYADVWVQLCRAAERTEHIGLGPGVLVPSLRHPMTTAAAIAQLVSIAGAHRVAVGVGSGFTGRYALGQRPLRWAAVEEYVTVLSGLLRGKTVSWDGAVIQMLHRPDFAPARPIIVPFIIAASGPKGLAVATRVGDGVLSAGRPVPGFDWNTVLIAGTVLDEGEDPGSERVLAAAGPGASVRLHAALEFGTVPRSATEWAAAYADLPAETRHLAIHDGHLCAITDRDRPFITGDLLTRAHLAVSPPDLRDRIAALAEAGATEIAYQPAGPDIPRELEAFAEAAGVVTV